MIKLSNIETSKILEIQHYNVEPDKNYVEVFAKTKYLHEEKELIDREFEIVYQTHNIDNLIYSPVLRVSMKQEHNKP